MSNRAIGRVRLVDDDDASARTTTTLVASLASRLAVLHLMTGADALGSIASGLCALGRAVGETADGARMARALESGRAGMNGDHLWTTLRIGDWVSSLPPSPMLDQLRNDFSLLLAPDLSEAIDLMPIPGGVAGVRGMAENERATSVDFLVGLWAFSQEAAVMIERLAAPTMPVADTVTGAPLVGAPPDGPLLR